MATLGSSKKYFRLERAFLLIGGISLANNHNRAYKVYSWIVMGIFGALYLVVGTMELFRHSIYETIDSWFYLIGTFMALTLSIATFRSRYKLGNLLGKLEDEPFLANTERGGDEEKKLMESWRSFQFKQALTFVACVILSMFSQMVFIFIKRAMSSDYHDWNMGFVRIPFINITYSPNYELVTLYQNFCIGYMSINACAITLIFSGCLALVRTQFKMLQNYIRKMVKANRENVEEDSLSDTPRPSEKYLNQSVKTAVLYHLSILEIIADLEKMFNSAMLSIYSLTFTALCVEVYRISLLPPNDIRTFRVLIEMVTAGFHAFLYCFNGEQMTAEGQEVAQAAYSVNFVGTDMQFQKSLIMIMRRSQEPRRVKAGNLIETSLVTFAAIMRASYSAYMVLMKMNMQEE